MSDFSGNDYDFAAGSLKGLRTWGVDDEGRLRGITHRAVWRPGENVSVCKQPADEWVHCGDEGCDLCAEEIRKRDEPHHFDPDCGCGFWAYDEMGFKLGMTEPMTRVVGIIEGYGKTTIGTKGFRCEKARVVALCRWPGPGNDELRLSVWQRLQALYPAVDFHDEYDDMVEAHPSVLKEWAAPGEGFWDAPDSRMEFSVGGLVFPAPTFDPTPYRNQMHKLERQLSTTQVRMPPISCPALPWEGATTSEDDGDIADNEPEPAPRKTFWQRMRWSE